MRVGARAPRRVGDADPPHQVERPLARRRRATGRGAPAGASAIWSPTRITGLSAVIGSWKIIAIDPPRRSAAAPAGRCRHEVLALEQHLAAGDLRRAGAAGPGSRAASCSCRSRTRRRARAPRRGSTVNDAPSTACTVPRVSGISTCRSRTSRSGAALIPAAAGRRAPSPISESPSPVITTASPGMVDSCHLVVMNVCPSAIIVAPVGRRRLDAEAEVAERDDRSRMSSTMSDIANTIACVMTLGSRWRTMMRGVAQARRLGGEHVLLAFGDEHLARG